MSMSNSRCFYIISLAVLSALSAYPLANGIRIAYIGIINGAITPEQFAKYVVPYAAICISLLWFAAFQPLFFKLKRFSFPVGLASAYILFFAAEHFFETIQIHTGEMSLIDASALMPYTADFYSTADIWQAALCVVSPVIQDKSLTYMSQDRIYFVISDNLYKVHYYLISLILISMVCGLVYGIAKMLRENDFSRKKSILLQGISTSSLVSLCVFANTTAFFRQAAAIQTPLASALTGLFFVILGVSAGVYAGSFSLKKGKFLRSGVPVLLSIFCVMLMYAGEALMMQGNLYRFGTGWFFEGINGVFLAPADILIVLSSGAMTWLITNAARKYTNWPGKRTIITVAAFCIIITAMGATVTLISFEDTRNDILGYYAFEENLFTNPLSSFMAIGELPYVYEFNENAFTITNTNNGSMQEHSVRYCEIPVATDEFFSSTDFLYDWLPDVTEYKERHLLAVTSNGNNLEYRLYRMDGEIWLIQLRETGIWSIYKLQKTESIGAGLWQNP